MPLTQKIKSDKMDIKVKIERGITMKKRLLAFLLVVFAVMAMTVPSLADDSISDLQLSGSNWNEQGCKPSMLNFGYARVPLGKSLYDMNNEGKCTTIKKSIKAKQIESLLSDGNTLYIYAKFSGKNINYLAVEANLIVTAPDGRYYRTDDAWTITDCSGPYHFSWFLDVTKSMKAVKEDNGGSIPRGTYDFSLFFNGDTFRTATVQFK